MATTVDTLLVRIESDMSGIKRDLKRLETQTSQTSKSVKRSFAGVGTAIKSAIGVVLVQQLARGTIALANFASDIEEMQAMSEAVFGQFVGTVRDQLGEFADSVGRSSFELEKMAASVQDTFVPMGYARDEAAKLSVNLTKLAVDVGSFKNVSEQMTMESFTSALVGNHETVRKFGIVIDEAGIKQELFRMGITKAYKEVDVATKVQARYNLIVAGTTDAQGDALKTADSYANLSRKLNAELGYLAADIGMALLPNMKELLKFTIDVTESFRQMVKVFGVGLTLDEELFKTGQQMAVLEEKMASLLRIATNSKNLDVARTAAMREMAIVEQQLAELRAKAVDLANKKFGLDKKATEAANDNVEANKQVNLTLSDTEKFLKNITESTEILTLKRDKASALTILQKEAEHQLGKEYSENKTKINEAIKANHNLLVSMEKLKEEEDRRAALQTEGQAKLDDLIKKEAMLTAELDGQTETQLRQLEVAFQLGNLEGGRTEQILRQIELNAKQQSSVNALKKAEDARNGHCRKRG